MQLRKVKKPEMFLSGVLEDIRGLSIFTDHDIQGGWISAELSPQGVKT